MKITLLPPAIVIYTDRVPKGSAGVANAFVVRIRPKYKNDVGLLAHELEHVRQWWVLPLISDFMYLFSKRYRMWAEAEAYRKQIKAYPSEDRNRFAAKAVFFLMQKYNLDLSTEKAKKLIS